MTTISERIVPSAVAASLAAAMLLAGCSAAQPNADAEASAPQTEAPAASQAGAVTFTDDTGAEVTVDNPQRVVACMGSFASIWELAGGTLVGASDDAFTLSDYDLKSENVQKVGDFSNPNLESIIALEPDFVIMTSGSGGRGGDSNQGVNLAGVCMESRRKRHRGSIGTAASQSRYVIVLVDSLKTGDDYDLSGIQFMADALGIDPF